MIQQDTSLVPGREHYSLRYLRGGRVFSYAHQINSVLEFEPRSVLEIGVGTGMVAAALRAVGIQVTTVDIQPDLNPDIVASVTDLPLADNAVDVALCCQVLEHLPFEQFEPALRELYRTTRSGVVISLPDVTKGGFIHGKLPKLRFRFEWNWPRLSRRSFPASRTEEMGHYWEIGFHQFSVSRIIKAATTANWTVRETWRNPELPWHRFFCLTK